MKNKMININLIYEAFEFGMNLVFGPKCKIFRQHMTCFWLGLGDSEYKNMLIMLN